MTFRKSMLVMIVMFFITTLLMPVAILNKLLFIAIVAIMIGNTSKYSILYTVSPIIIGCIFLYGFLISFFNYSDRELSDQFLLSVSVLFLIYPIIKYEFDMDYITKVCGIVLTLYTSISFWIMIQMPGSAFLEFFGKYSLGGYAEREFSDEITRVYLVGATPYLFLPFCLFLLSFLKKKKIVDFLGLILISAAIIFSASRGLIVTSFITLLLLLFLNLRLMNKVIFLLISIPIMLFLVNYLLTNTILFSGDEISNRTKIGHITSFFDNITFFNFFIGDGLAAYYFSKGINGFKAHTEITPLDMFRYFGFIFGILLYVVILFPTFNIKSYLGENKLDIVIFVMYLVFSLTNPIMFNSFGLLIVLWYWSKILSNKNCTHKFATS